MEEITTTQLDEALVKMREARRQYESIKEQASEAYKHLEVLENNLLEMLEKAEKSKWQVDGVGSVSLANRVSVQTPKNIEDKKALWSYIKQTYGEEAAFEKFSVNSNTLRAFYNAEFEASENKAFFSLPGVSEPVIEKELRFRKA